MGRRLFLTALGSAILLWTGADPVGVVTLMVLIMFGIVPLVAWCWRRMRPQPPTTPAAPTAAPARPAARRDAVRRSRYIRAEEKLLVYQRAALMDPAGTPRCVVCGAPDDLEVDHIIAFDLGGSNNESNLQLLCGTCNRTKGNRPKMPAWRTYPEKGYDA